MKRDDRARLDDVLSAADAVRRHLDRGSLDDGLVFDAVRMRLLEIGEAVKAIGDELLAEEPTVPWRQVAGMRDVLAHRYFDTVHGVVEETVMHDLPGLVAAVQRLIDRLP